MKKFALVLATVALAGCNAPKALVAPAPAALEPATTARPSLDDAAARDAQQAVAAIVAKLPSGHRSLQAYSDPLRAAMTLLGNVEAGQATWPKLADLGAGTLIADATASDLAFTQALAVGQPFSTCRPLPEVGYVVCQLMGIDAARNLQYRAHGQNGQGWAFDDTVSVDTAHGVFYIQRNMAAGPHAAAETAAFVPSTGAMKYVVQLDGRPVIAINP